MTTHQPTDEPRFIRVEEAARQLGISRGLAYRQVRAGTIPSVKLGKRRLIPADVVNRLLAQANRPAA